MKNYQNLTNEDIEKMHNFVEEYAKKMRSIDSSYAPIYDSIYKRVESFLKEVEEKIGSDK